MTLYRGVLLLSRIVMVFGIIVGSVIVSGGVFSYARGDVSVGQGLLLFGFILEGVSLLIDFEEAKVALYLLNNFFRTLLHKKVNQVMD